MESHHHEYDEKIASGDEISSESLPDDAPEGVCKNFQQVLSDGLFDDEASASTSKSVTYDENKDDKTVDDITAVYSEATMFNSSKEKAKDDGSLLRLDKEVRGGENEVKSAGREYPDASRMIGGDIVFAVNDLQDVLSDSLSDDEPSLSGTLHAAGDDKMAASDGAVLEGHSRASGDAKSLDSTSADAEGAKALNKDELSGLTSLIGSSGNKVCGTGAEETLVCDIDSLDSIHIKETSIAANSRKSPVSVAATCDNAAADGCRCRPTSTARFDAVPWAIAQEIDNLTPRQRDALVRIFDGENVFVTGRGGTGKSAILRLVAGLNRDGPYFMVGKLAFKTKVVVACAPTGIAASSMAFPGSSTIHSRLGISSHCKTPEELIRNLKRTNPETLETWVSMEVLIIDEISMVTAELLDLIIGTVVCLQGSLCQVVLLGDWLQLPPISNRTAFDSGRNFAFKAKCWKELFPFQNVVQLLVSHRHKDSAVLDLICQEVRQGRVDSSTSRLIELHEPDEGLKNEDFTTVTTRKNDAARVNDEFMRKLGGEIVKFTAKDVCKEFCSPPLRDSFMRSCLAERELNLCVGAKVVLVKNLSIPSGLVNGAQGVVKEFVRMENGTAVYPVCEFWGVDTSREESPPASFHLVDGCTSQVLLMPVDFSLTRMNGKFEETLCTRTMIPVIRSFALTAHKAQSLTIPVLSCNFSGV